MIRFIAASCLPLLPLLVHAQTPAQSRLGMNLAGPADWGTEHPFVDVFKMSRKWISQRPGQPWGKGPELVKDQHGWVKRLEPDCSAETPVLTGGHAPSGVEGAPASRAMVSAPPWNAALRQA